MVALFVQTLLLMTAAYFVGAAVACFVRRSLTASSRPEAASAHPVEPLPEMARPAEGSLRLSDGGFLFEAATLKQARGAETWSRYSYRPCC